MLNDVVCYVQTQIVVAVFPTARDDRYSAVKKVCCVEKPVPSQVSNSCYSLVFVVVIVQLANSGQ